MVVLYVRLLVVTTYVDGTYTGMYSSGPVPVKCTYRTLHTASASLKFKNF